MTKKVQHVRVVISHGLEEILEEINRLCRDENYRLQGEVRPYLRGWHATLTRDQMPHFPEDEGL